MGQAQINVRTRACSGTFIARTKQAALTHNVRGKRLIMAKTANIFLRSRRPTSKQSFLVCVTAPQFSQAPLRNFVEIVSYSGVKDEC